MGRVIQQEKFYYYTSCVLRQMLRFETDRHLTQWFFQPREDAHGRGLTI